MKKLLLSAIVLAGGFVGASAQDLVFMYEGKALENNATLVYDKWEVKTLPTGLVQVVINPHINIMSVGEDADVNITATSVTGNEIQLCAGSTCIKGVSVEKQNVALGMNEPLDLEFDAVTTFYPGQQAEADYYEVVLTAWFNYDVDKEEMITLTVKMGDLSKAGVDSISADNGNVRVFGKTLSYDVVGNNAITVYSLSGKSIISRQISGSGNISLANLPSGVYLYKLAGKKGKSGKFIIK